MRAACVRATHALGHHLRLIGVPAKHQHRIHIRWPPPPAGPPQVEEALREQETTGVGAMQAKLLGLQEEINEARSRLQVSQARVELNLQRVDELKAEAVGDVLCGG